jgi:DNA-binding NarL/FixJ family response regulator
MDNLTMVITDVATGITTERELNAEEIAQHELDVANALTQQAEQEAKATARQSALAKLADLGLTAEEIAAL